jgi:hypothetical protein
MTNALFPNGKSGMMTGLIDLDTAVIKVALVRSYTWDNTDVFMSDIVAGGTIVGTPQTLGSITTTNGVFDAADSTFTSVTAGAAIGCLIIYQASAVTGGADVANTSQRVICFIDTGTGLPVTPNGSNIVITWDSGSNKIFAL